MVESNIPCRDKISPTGRGNVYANYKDSGTPCFLPDTPLQADGACEPVFRGSFVRGRVARRFSPTDGLASVNPSGSFAPGVLPDGFFQQMGPVSRFPGKAPPRAILPDGFPTAGYFGQSLRTTAAGDRVARPTLNRRRAFHQASPMAASGARSGAAFPG